VFIVQRSVVGDLSIALGDLFLELYWVSKGYSGVEERTYACDLAANLGTFDCRTAETRRL
jgi:hypothetical protein